MISSKQNEVTIVITRPDGHHIPMTRQRSFSVPIVDFRGRQLHSNTNSNNRNAAAKELPPTYTLAISHPSIYKKKDQQKKPVSRQETLSPPPHYDDLESGNEDLQLQMTASSPDLTSTQ